MDLFKRQEQMSSNTTVGAKADIDAGLRSYMLQVYNYMVSALLLTGVVAYFASQSEAFLSLMMNVKADGTVGMSPIAWVVMLAPLGVVFYLSARMNNMSINAARGWFWGFAFLMGLSLYYVFVLFTGASVTRVFFITAGTFGAMSLWGYTTKKDITGWGSYLFMAVIGIIIASVVNIFMQSSAMHFAISVIGVLVFTALIAYDTQKLKANYYQYGNNPDAIAKSSIMGALSLYLDFINLFVMLLRLFGERR